MNAPKYRVGTLGTCPVCEGEFKVRKNAFSTDDVMVHHGYDRPGDGRIHGDCFAVGMKPYELSAEGCEKYREVCESKLENERKFLASIPHRTTWRHSFVTSCRTNGRSTISHVDYAIGVTDRYVWERFVEGKVRECEYHIADLEREIHRMTRLIEAWTPKPLREVTEEAASAAKTAAANARKAEREAKNAAKAARRAEIDRKHAAREEKRLAALDTFLAVLRTIRDSDAADKHALAEDAWYRFFCAKTARAIGRSALSDCYYDLRRRGHEPLLVAVGLAEQDARGFVSYRCSSTF